MHHFFWTTAFYLFTSFNSFQPINAFQTLSQAESIIPLTPLFQSNFFIEQQKFSSQLNFFSKTLQSFQPSFALISWKNKSFGMSHWINNNFFFQWRYFHSHLNHFHFLIGYRQSFCRKKTSIPSSLLHFNNLFAHHYDDLVNDYPSETAVIEHFGLFKGASKK